jgi:anti-sigma-K factor RskA
MTHEQFREHVPLYVVGALDGDELHEFERYAAEHRAACEPEIAEFQAIADQIALGAPPAAPSPAVFHRVMATIEDYNRMVTRARVAERREREEFSVGALVFRWMPWVATAALAALVVVLNGRLHKVNDQLAVATTHSNELVSQGTNQQSKFVELNGQIAELTARIAAQSTEFKEQTDQLRTQNAEQKQDIEALQAVNNRLTAEKAELQRIADELRQKLDRGDAQVAALEKKLTEQAASLELVMDPAIRVAQMTDPKGQTKAIAKVYWHDVKKTGLVVVSNLDPVVQGKGKCLELWTICGTEKPVAAGIGWTDASGHGILQIKLEKPIACADKFAVSVERAGGVPAPEGPIVLLGP